MNLHNCNVKLIDFGSSGVIKDKEQLTEIELDTLEKDVKNLNEIICEFGKIIPTQNLQK